jgi:acetyl-CoA/propionyl-CoA carboxylase carboxyl transferase subunit
MTVGVSRAPVGDGAADSGLVRSPARLTQLLDAGSMDVLALPGDGEVTSATGRIGGEPVVAYAVGASTVDGVLSVEGSRRVVEAIDTAVSAHRPVIGLWHSGGVRLGEGVGALNGLGQVLAAIARASGRVPQVSVALGPCDGGVGYAPALTDILVAAPAGRLTATGSVMVAPRLATNGGLPVRDRGFDGAHIRAADEADAIARARHVVTLLTRPGRFDPGSDDLRGDPRALLPRRARRAYDVKPLLRQLLDDDPHGLWFEELQPRWAPNMVVGLGRLLGATVGVLANNPLRKGGCLDSPSAEKAARFVRMCDAFGIPMVVVVDVPGYLPGVEQEWEGVVRRGAKLLHAFAEAVVPRVTLVTRKSYGGAYIAMNASSLGATAVFAWPEAEIAVMGAKAAVRILHRRTLAAASESEREAVLTGLVEEHERAVGGVDLAVRIGVVDEVIHPSTTRRRLAEALAAAPATRGTHDNIPL